MLWIPDGIDRLEGFHWYDSNSKQLVLGWVSRIDQRIVEYKEFVEKLIIRKWWISLFPDFFAELNSLKVAFIMNNPVWKVPWVFSGMGMDFLALKSCSLNTFEEWSHPNSLSWLILTDNPELWKLPKSIGNIGGLKKVWLVWTWLHDVPSEIERCREVELFRIAANNFPKDPSEKLFDYFPKLAWYSDAGNPFCENGKIDNIPNIFWNDIEIIEPIWNVSQSSDVFRARIKWQNIEVAVKLFKWELTSDWKPMDDMHAALVAWIWHNLIELKARLMGHPEGKQGLVLWLIPSSYNSLGLPPNFDTCLRDRFTKWTNFSIKYILQVLKDISLAWSHIHGKWVMHGDIYAHNILSNIKWKSLLWDFWAASVYATSNKTNTRELVDVRAFWYLIDDLLKNTYLITDWIQFLKLQNLRDICMNINYKDRLSFREVNNILLNM